MTKSFEHTMRRAMEALGHVVESVIGKAKQATVQVSTRGGVQPILSVESQLSASRIRDIIELSTQKVLSGILPDLKGKTALEVGEGPVSWAGKLLGAQANLVVGVEVGGGSVGRQGDSSRGFVLRGQVARLPFEKDRFSYVLARLATQLQGDMMRALRELSRVMAPGAQGVLVDYHPFGLYAKRGASRVRPADSGIQRLEDYYRFCRQAGLRVVDVREAFVDEAARQFFREGEIGAYRNLKGTPILVFLFVYKPKGA